MATIFIDNIPYRVADGQNLLRACLSLGFNIPYFCWHPAIHAVGACRQCAVKQFRDEKDSRGFIIMSCMCEVTDGMRISIDDPEAKQFRASVIEWMMANHPHDCPVCDEGGECHLQDMTVMTGHVYRNHRFAKRTYRNQDLGPFINHEMNRCIQCYRCVRFYRDYAGGRDFNAFGIHRRVYFGRFQDGPLENEFSGNLVEICPTGVFTDKTQKKHYTRKWDLQTAPSVCPHCGVGCNIVPGERYGTLRRIRNRFHNEINGYFLCDRGRFGYEFVNHDKRIRRAVIRSGGNESQEYVSAEQALQRIKSLMDSSGVIGIGSPRASLESNFLLRELVGEGNFYQGVAEPEKNATDAILHVLQKTGLLTASVRDLENCDAVFVLGEDPTNYAPRISLALRQSVRVQPMEKLGPGIPLWNDTAVRQVIQDQSGPLYIASSYRSKLDDIATELLHAAPADLARLGFAVACEIDPQAPSVEALDDRTHSLAERIARSLVDAERPAVVSGCGSGSLQVLHAATNVALALQKKNRSVKICFTVPECNSLGAALLGGESLDKAFSAVSDGTADTAIVLENDLFRRQSPGSVEEFFNNVKHLIVIDCIENRTVNRAEIILPGAVFTESVGTFVNNEARAQRFFQVMQPVEEAGESRAWLSDLIELCRPEARTWSSMDEITAALAACKPVFKEVAETAPDSTFRIAGLKIARQHHRYSGRTSMHADVDVNEPTPPQDPDSPLSFSMEGFQGRPPSPLIPRFWAPSWNSPQSLNKFQAEVGGPLKGGDPGKRLISPDSTDKAYFTDIPNAFEISESEWTPVPIHHIFGSEELGILSPALMERSPKPYLGMNEKDCEKIAAKENDYVEVESSGNSYKLPVKIIPGLPEGVVGIPFNLPGLEGMDFACRIKPRGREKI